jgi:hypothetical protein
MDIKICKRLTKIQQSLPWFQMQSKLFFKLHHNAMKAGENGILE